MSLKINKQSFLEAYYHCEQTLIQDHEKALHNIQQCLNPQDNPAPILEKVIQKLTGSRITVNCDLSKTFYASTLVTATDEATIEKILVGLSNTFFHKNERQDRHPDYQNPRNLIESIYLSEEELKSLFIKKFHTENPELKIDEIKTEISSYERNGAGQVGHFAPKIILLLVKN